jgi:hypothetical protein
MIFFIKDLWNPAVMSEAVKFLSCIREVPRDIALLSPQAFLKLLQDLFLPRPL